MKITDVNETCRHRALCRTYFVAVFTSSKLTVRFKDGMHDLQVGWGIGLLPNTEAEVLGLWVQPTAIADAVRDLRERGVERIAFAIDAGWRAAAEAALIAYPRAHCVPSTEHFVRRITQPLKPGLRAAACADLRAAFSGGGEAALLGAVQAVAPAGSDLQASLLVEAQQLRKSLAELSEQDRRFVLAADRTATVLLEELARAVQRNGYFLNQDAALEFVAKALSGAERRMDRERAAMAAQAGTLRAASQRCLAVSRAV